MENLESLLNYIIKELVETKDKVNVTYEVVDSNVTFKVSVAKGEMGKIIGKNGLTANAIRGVMQAAGVKDKLNVSVEFFRLGVNMELLIAGKVLGSHNLKGEVKVISDLDNIEALVGNKVILELAVSQQKLLTIKKIEHLVANKWIFSFEEIKNKQDTIEIRNANIKVRRDIVGIGEDEYLVSDMIGFKVYDVKGDEYLGEITEIMDTAAHDIYVIESEEFETMIPDVDVFIKNIDFENKKMLVDTIEGMKEPKVKK